MRFSNQILFLLIWLASHNGISQSIEPSKDVSLFVENVFHLSEVMLHDVANPPAASRFYAYAMLGAYEVVYLSDASLPQLNNRFKEKLNILAPVRPKRFYVSFTAIFAMLDVGRQIMPSGYLLEREQKKTN
jgi:hypothetical protein